MNNDDRAEVAATLRKALEAARDHGSGRDTLYGERMAAALATLPAAESEKPLPVPGVDGCPEWARWIAWAREGAALVYDEGDEPKRLAHCVLFNTDRHFVALPAFNDPSRAGTSARLVVPEQQAAGLCPRHGSFVGVLCPTCGEPQHANAVAALHGECGEAAMAAVHPFCCNKNTPDGGHVPCPSPNCRCMTCGIRWGEHAKQFRGQSAALASVPTWGSTGPLQIRGWLYDMKGRETTITTKPDWNKDAFNVQSLVTYDQAEGMLREAKARVAEMERSIDIELNIAKARARQAEADLAAANAKLASVREAAK